MTKPAPASSDSAHPPDYLRLEDPHLLAQCRVDTYRASGPGGQKRNKTSSAVRLRHDPTGLLVIAEETRSQHENKARALRRLRQAIALHIRRPVNPESYVLSELLRSCISGESRICLGRRDARYNSAVQEILDCLAACETRVSTTAALLGVTTSELTGFFRADQAVWRRVNEMRTAAGARSLH